MTQQTQYDQLKKLLSKATFVTIVQPDNPDADSLGSAIALENILSDYGKDVAMHCPVDIPHYLQYIKGWDRVQKLVPQKSDLIIIVDTSSASLLEKTSAEYNLNDKNVVMLDHHQLEEDSVIDVKALHIEDPTSAATGELIVRISKYLDLSINAEAAESLIFSILGDTLGLTTPTTTADTIEAIATLVRLHGISLGELDQRRRELSRKPIKTIAYKGQLLQRVSYLLDNQVAFVDVTLDEIKEYSHLYNPAVLALEDIRMAEEVRIGIVFKLYEDKITAKLREVNNAPICRDVAEHFGGGGHPAAAGFKVARTDVKALKKEVLKQIATLLQERDQESL